MNTTPNAPMTDDELGAALGASVRSRVDDIPTITPSFDGVERRARQITQRRRTAAGLAIGALVAFGGLGLSTLLADDEGANVDDVVTEPEPEPEPDAEEVTVADDDRVAFDFILDEVTVTALVDDSTRFVAKTDAGQLTLVEVFDGRQIVMAVALADQTLVWGESSAPPGLWQEVWLKRPDGEPELALQAHRLNGAAMVDGVPYAFVSDTGADAPTLERVNLLDLTREVLTTADDGTTFFPVDIRDDLLIVPTFSSAGGEWRYVWFDGTPAYNDIRLAPPEGSDITRWSVRFGHNDSNIWWLESNAETTEWALVNGTEVGVEVERVELDTGIDDAVLMSLEITDGQMAINLLQAGATPLAFDTIWVDPSDLSTTVGHDEGAVSFIEQGSSSGGLIVRSPANVDISELGVTMLNDINERDFTLADVGPTPAEMAGLDENGVVWIVGLPSPEATETILFDRWQAEEATDIRWVDGGVLLQIGSTVVDVNWWAGELGHRVTDNGRLVGATTIGSDRYAFIVDGDTNDLLLVDLRLAESSVILPAADQAGRVENVHLGAGVVLVEGTTGSQPWFRYLDLLDDGTAATPGRSAADLASPTDGRYGADWGGLNGPREDIVHGATLSAADPRSTGSKRGPPTR